MLHAINMMIIIYHSYLYPQKSFLGIHTDWNRIEWLLFSSSNERPYKLHRGTIKEQIDCKKNKAQQGKPSNEVIQWFRSLSMNGNMTLSCIFTNKGGGKHVWNAEFSLPRQPLTSHSFGAQALIYFFQNWVFPIVKILSNVERFSLCLGFWQLGNPISLTSLLSPSIQSLPLYSCVPDTESPPQSTNKNPGGSHIKSIGCLLEILKRM